jgi:hypothetical protein
MSPRPLFLSFRIPTLIIVLATTVSAQAPATPPGGANDPVVSAQNITAQQGVNWNEFKSELMKRYDQKVVVTRVAGLQAGEKTSSFGAGQAGMHWHHFQAAMPLPEKVTSGLLFSNKLSDMQRLDDRTFGKLIHGVNTTAIEKNERLKVSKLYVYSDFIEFVLAATEAGHMRDIDVAKANTDQYGNTRVFHDFGFVFRFHFDKQSVLKTGGYQTMVAEIGKYLLPQDEADTAIAAEKNIELEIGMPEMVVIEKLGQPIRSIKVGDQRFLKYKEMTVIIKDGKVAEVKVE